jgi:RNA 2',3'-cyclic 3'-phosphodiesterase
MPDTVVPKHFRLFIAISLPEPVKDEIEKAQAELRRALPGEFVRWTKREQFHLTLRFLGNVDSQRVSALAESLRNASQEFSSLHLRAERIGFFPDARFPRVIWTWVHDEKESLPVLQAAIESGVREFTTENAEGRFTGHVTLGRVKAIKRPQVEILAQLAERLSKIPFGEWTADKVELIRSELASGGSRYTVLETAALLK